MQIPVGGLVDRIGPRRMIVVGAVVMAAGQLLLATAHEVPLAVLARILVGGGDAMTFVSVLRLVASWFPQSRIPIVTQLTGITGQLGQLAAAYPLLALLHSAGWTATFAGAAGLGLITAVVVRATVRDTPPGAEPPEQLDGLRALLRLSWLERGTRLGLWTHFVSQFSGLVFVLVWGYPFLVKGEGLSPATAGTLLTLMVPLGIASGLGFGHLVSRWPLRRSTTIVAVVLTTAAAWTAVLAWPGRAPLPLLVLLVAVLATNGPASAVGFDFARTFNPKLRVGSATGIVNVGGFVASLTTILAIGLILDALTPAGSTDYSLGSFRAAFSIQYLVWAAGLYAVVRHRRHLRRLHVEQTGVPIDPLHRAALRRLRAGRRGQPLSRSS
jgi:nitrate/nitrite transporter NarK